jgi:hypothetical protein
VIDLNEKTIRTVAGDQAGFRDGPKARFQTVQVNK